MIFHMRAYKFLSKQFGLKSLYEGRLKQSRIHELNDPFELAPYDLTDPSLRCAFLSLKEQMGRENGLICFSASWNNSVIWAHYSDQHRGLCLGFDVPEITGDGDSDIAQAVEYIPAPWKFPPNFLNLPIGEQLKHANRIPFTKFDDWSYEEEIRIWGRLSNEEDSLHFVEFDDDKIRLVEVIIGARCALKASDMTRAFGTRFRGVNIRRVRAAYDKFEMVEDENGIE
jgi:hypothetical protein